LINRGKGSHRSSVVITNAEKEMIEIKKPLSARKTPRLSSTLPNLLKDKAPKLPEEKSPKADETNVEPSAKAKVVIHETQEDEDAKPALKRLTSKNDGKKNTKEPVQEKPDTPKHLKISEKEKVENTNIQSKTENGNTENMKVKQAPPYLDLKKHKKLISKDFDIDKMYRAQLTNPLSPLLPYSPRTPQQRINRIEEALLEATEVDNIFKKMNIYNQLIQDIKFDKETNLLPQAIRALALLIAHLEPYQQALIDLINIEKI